MWALGQGLSTSKGSGLFPAHQARRSGMGLFLYKKCQITAQQASIAFCGSRPGNQGHSGPGVFKSPSEPTEGWKDLWLRCASHGRCLHLPWRKAENSRLSLQNFSLGSAPDSLSGRPGWKDGFQARGFWAFLVPYLFNVYMLFFNSETVS